MRLVLPRFAATLRLAARADASCMPIIYWQDEIHVAFRTSVPRADRLAPLAVQPACNDAGQNDPDTKFAVYRIRGVHPQVAVASPGRVYVNSATFPQFKSHPLHKPLRLTDKPERRWGTACTVTGTTGRYTRMYKVGNRYVEVAVDTKISLRRHGTAYIEPGTQVRVRGKCLRDRVAATHLDRG